MKILVIGHSYITKPNQEKFHFISHLAENIEILLIIPNNWRDKYFPIRTFCFNSTNKRIHIISLPVIFAGNGSLYFFRTFKLISIINSFQPDIIQVDQEPHSLLYLQVLIFKQIVTPKSKLIFFSWNNLPNRRPLSKKIIVSLFQMFALKHSDGAICGNNEGEKLLKAMNFKKPIAIIPQFGVNTFIYKKIEVSNLRKSLDLNSSFVIGYAGRIIKSKGILTLLKALTDLKDYNWKLLLIGDGELLPEIFRIATLNSISHRIIHIRSVDQYEIIKYINCMDVLVLPSLTTRYWKEQFGKVLIEAMACEVPVIASNSGAIPWVVGNAGLIFPEGNVEKLKSQILTLMHQIYLRKQLIKLGKQLVEKEFSNEVIAKKYLNFYKILIK